VSALEIRPQVHDLIRMDPGSIQSIDAPDFAFSGDHNTANNQQLAPASLTALGKYTLPLPYVIARAVQRHGLPVGANPTRQLSLQPVVIGAAVEVTRRLKPSV